MSRASFLEIEMRKLLSVFVAMWLALGATTVFAADGKYRTILTSGSPTTCTVIESNAFGSGRLTGVFNGGTVQTATLTFFDDAGTCAAADQIFAVATPAVGLAIAPSIALKLGLSYTLSAALAGNLVVTYN